MIRKLMHRRSMPLRWITPRIPFSNLIVAAILFLTIVTLTIDSLQIPKSVPSRNLSCRSICPVSSSLKGAIDDPETVTTSSSSSVQQQPQPQQIPTLTTDTTWMIRLTIQKSITNTNTMTSLSDPLLFVLYGQFVPTENYEPPQGTFVQQKQQQDNDNNNNLQITTKSRWILSEDPNDRKDGLWIWGLFQQPLYPYMLFTIETEPYTSSNSFGSSTNNNNNIILPALQLYVQLDHTCDRTTGAVSFTAKQRENYPLMIRQVETIAADPLQLSKVDIYDEITIGTLSIQPVT